MKKIHFVQPLILITSVILTIIPFFQTGLFDVHDPTSAFRLSTLVSTISSGQFPASWNNSLNFGFGYPLHLYYAPLFTYLGAIFTSLVSAEIAVKIALVIASFVGTIGVYFSLLSIGPYAATVAAVAFTYLPYRASALYVRGSYAEFLAMSLLPWVIYFWTKQQRSKQVILTTAILTALFALSHNTLPILVAPIILLTIFLYQGRYIKGSVLAFLATIGLTAWFILPVFLERSFVQVDSVARLTNFRDHFLSIGQLWYSRWGYGGSSAGVANDQMSFMIGKGQIILALIGVFALLKNKSYKILSLLGFVVLFAVFLSLEQSRFIWEAFPLLSVMQFPWRSLAVAGVGVALLSGYSLTLVPVKFRGTVAIILTILLIFTNYTYFHPQEYRNYNQDILTSQSNLDPLVRDKIPEYLPIWMPNFPGSGIADSLTRTPTKVFGTVVLPYAEPLTISTAYMPQWQLTLNGTKEQIKPNENGLITTVNNIQSGSHSVSLTWHRTQVENIGLTISALTIIVVVGLLFI
jgi:hypothetical protein